MNVSIIGTAGRGSAITRLNKQVYLNMYNHCLSILPKEPNTLISGGAAWSDHLAVSLFLAHEVNNLTLYLPALWDQKRMCFYGNKDANTANYYHELFSNKMGGNTLHGIQRAIEAGAIFFEIQEGFLARNIFVGNTDKIIAFGFEKGTEPQSAGTRHTWTKSSCRDKIYVNINDLPIKK